MQAQHEVVGGKIERYQLQMRLQCEARTAVKCGDLFEGERVTLGAVKCLDKSPFDAGNVESQTMAAAGELRIGASQSASFEPRLRSENERLGCAVR